MAEREWLEVVSLWVFSLEVEARELEEAAGEFRTGIFSPHDDERRAQVASLTRIDEAIGRIRRCPRQLAKEIGEPPRGDLRPVYRSAELACEQLADTAALFEEHYASPYSRDPEELLARAAGRLDASMESIATTDRAIQRVLRIQQEP
ncbi:MAG: hypothetical protein OXG37_00215 [Actinomycetia bacterium]|nr:hypothetical protein [Actinomycetes bacterium]